MSATLSAAEAEAFVRARERFGVRLGLERIERLLAELDHPQRRYPAIHVVGTNAKSTTVRRIEALLEAAGQRTGAYLSPHVTTLGERFRVGGSELEIADVIAPVLDAVAHVDRSSSEPITQFELLTAAALHAFCVHQVDVAIIEAGLGGRYDATNVLSASIVVLTNVALEHQEQLGTTRDAIAREKLAVVGDEAIVVLGEPEWERRGFLPKSVDVFHAESVEAMAVAAAELHLGRSVDPAPAASVSLPGRLELIAESPRELWDGAHNPHAVSWLARELVGGEHVLVLSVLGDKDLDAMLRSFSEIGRILVATRSSNPRALPAGELAERARTLRCFEQVEAIEDVVRAREHGLELAALSGLPLLVSGSLYLLHDLIDVRPRRVP